MRCFQFLECPKFVEYATANSVYYLVDFGGGKKIQDKFWGAYDVPNGLHISPGPLRIPNMCLVFKLDNRRLF